MIRKHFQTHFKRPTLPWRRGNKESKKDREGLEGGREKGKEAGQDYQPRSLGSMGEKSSTQY